jgi:hypothetical protein
VAVFGTFPMNGYDAHGFINNLNNGYAPGGMRFELYGDDNGEGDRTVTLNRWFAGADTKAGGLYARKHRHSLSPRLRGAQERSQRGRRLLQRH